MGPGRPGLECDRTTGLPAKLNSSSAPSEALSCIQVTTRIVGFGGERRSSYRDEVVPRDRRRGVPARSGIRSRHRRSGDQCRPEPEGPARSAAPPPSRVPALGRPVGGSRAARLTGRPAPHGASRPPLPLPPLPLLPPYPHSCLPLPSPLAPPLEVAPARPPAPPAFRRWGRRPILWCRMTRSRHLHSLLRPPLGSAPRRHRVAAVKTANALATARMLSSSPLVDGRKRSSARLCLLLPPRRVGIRKGARPTRSRINRRNRRGRRGSRGRRGRAVGAAQPHPAPSWTPRTVRAPRGQGRTVEDDRGPSHRRAARRAPDRRSSRASARRSRRRRSKDVDWSTE